MGVKKIFIVIGIIVLLILGVCFGAYQCGAANTRNSLRAEGRAAEISRAHTELGSEQRTNTERLERIVGFTEKASRDARELRESNRRSGSLLSLLEQEVDILEDYLNSMQRELADYRGDNAGSGETMKVRE